MAPASATNKLRRMFISVLQTFDEVEHRLSIGRIPTHEREREREGSHVGTREVNARSSHMHLSRHEPSTGKHTEMIDETVIKCWGV